MVVAGKVGSDATTGKSAVDAFACSNALCLGLVEMQLSLDGAAVLGLVASSSVATGAFVFPTTEAAGLSWAVAWTELSGGLKVLASELVRECSIWLSLHKPVCEVAISNVGAGAAGELSSSEFVIVKVVLEARSRSKTLSMLVMSSGEMTRGEGSFIDPHRVLRRRFGERGKHLRMRVKFSVFFNVAISDLEKRAEAQICGGFVFFEY